MRTRPLGSVRSTRPVTRAKWLPRSRWKDSDTLAASLSVKDTSVPWREPTRNAGAARGGSDAGGRVILRVGLGPRSISLVACRSGAARQFAAWRRRRFAAAAGAAAVGVAAVGRTVPVAPETASVALPPSELVTRTVPGFATLANWPL